MVETRTTVPENTALRTALWRAMHVQVDPAPHVLTDEIGLRLAAPEENWRDRGDMDPYGTRRYRAGMVARARFVEDLVVERAGHGVDQYVILGAGLDTFAQRRPESAAEVRVFEVDQPGPQEWKRQRLVDLGFGVPDWLRLVPVDFEAEQWWDRLMVAGFDVERPAVVASCGVSMYLTKEANETALCRLARLAPGSTVAMTFQLPLDLLGAEDRTLRQVTERGARSAGTPFISFYAPDEMLATARAAGFLDAKHVSSDALNDRYFAGRSDGLRMGAEEMLVATS